MSRIVAIGAVAAAVIMTSVPARAQYAGVYGMPAAQPYAVEVAPGTYVIQHPDAPRAYPYVGCTRDCAQPGRPHRDRVHAAERPHHRNDPALIEELRHRTARKPDGKVIHTTKIVQDPPIVIEHRRVVDDPPRVIERRHYVEDTPHGPRIAAVESGTAERAEGRNAKRVIRAEAEVTILGPDRMSIRLFRKRGTDAQAKARE